MKLQKYKRHNSTEMNKENEGNMNDTHLEVHHSILHFQPVQYHTPKHYERKNQLVQLIINTPLLRNNKIL